jgi:hypothetical protein
MNRLSDPELGTYTDCAMAPLDAVEVMPDCSPWEDDTVHPPQIKVQAGSGAGAYSGEGRLWLSRMPLVDD